MKAITLTQPWATLMAIGAKRIETRSWQTSYRGPVAIHAAKGYANMTKREAELLSLGKPFIDVLIKIHHHWGPDMIHKLPHGAIVATATLIEINPIYGSWIPTRLQWHCERNWPAWQMDQELAFGNYAAKRFAWLFVDVRMLPTPIPAKGALGLWEWEASEGAA